MSEPGDSYSASGDGEYDDKPALRMGAFFATRPRGLYGPGVAAKRRAENARVRELEAELVTDDAVISGQPYWTPLGPSVNAHGQAAGQPPVSGKVSAIKVAPGGQRAYIGSANGGVWLTEDRGVTWRPIEEDRTTPPALRVGREQDSMAVGGIAVAFGATRAADVVYVGTGELVRMRPPGSSEDEFGSAQHYFGIGVLRYTWSGDVAVGTAEAAGPFGSPGSLAGQSFGTMFVDPANREVVWAATRIGFHARTGTGAWAHHQLAPAPAMDIACDVALAGTGTDRRVYVAYAGSGVVGIFDPTQSPPRFVGQISGIPTAPGNLPAYRLGITAVARGVGDHLVYALGESGRVYRAQASSETGFTEIAGSPLTGSQQLWFTMDIAVERGTTDVLWLAGSAAFDSLTLTRGTVDSTAGSLKLTNQTQIGTGIHADGHAIEFADDGTAWVGTDGGVWTAPAPYTLGTFVARNTGLAITQQTYMGADPNTDAIIYCGAQDNGLNRFRGSASWEHVGNGDGGGAAVNGLDPLKVFSGVCCPSGFQASIDGTNFAGKAVPFAPGSWNFYTPIATVMSPPAASHHREDHPLLAIAADKLYVSDDWAGTWEAVSVALRVAIGTGGPTAVAAAVAAIPGDRVVKVFGASPLDIAGAQRLQGTDTWKTIAGLTTTGLPANFHISALAVADAASNSLYVTLAGAASQRVWFFDGTTWHDSGLSAGGTPLNVPAHAVVCNGPSDVYVGTDVGVFKGKRTGTSWQWTPLNAGLPECAVTDLAIHAKTRLLRAATHGRGVWEMPLNPQLTQPDSELYFRANGVDTGRILNGSRLPGINGSFDPTVPGRVSHHWYSPDLKVIPKESLANPPAAADFLDHHLLVDRMDPTTSLELISSRTNHFFVQVHNRGWKSAGSLHVAVLVAACGAGVPPLGRPDYASLLAAGDLSFGGSQWFPVGPVRTPVGRVDARNPLVVSWLNVDFPSLGLPNTETHFCAVAFVTSPDDPRGLSSTSVDNLAISDPHVGQRNLQLLPLPPPGPVAAPEMIVVDAWNPSQDPVVVEIGFEAHEHVGDLSVVVSPVTVDTGVEVAGFAQVQLTEFDDPMAGHWQRWIGEAREHLAADDLPERPLLRAQVDQLAELDFSRVFMGRVTPERSPGFRGVRLPPGKRAVMAVAVHPADVRPGAILNVVQRQDGQVVRGTTIQLRQRPAAS
ncbi:MAG: hypothetical protein QOD71_2135 [Thermoleophilaceae bacterium]|nr:hypothetical protein [Thermoleophilaceae bacterium]